MQPEHLRSCVEAVDLDGYVTLEEAIDVEVIDALCEKMMADIKTVRKRRGIETGWSGVRPPPKHPHLYKDILLNEMAISVTHAVIGDEVTNDAYGANTAYPGARPQTPHADGGQLWAGLKEAHPPYAIAVNVPLVDVDEENGATQVWPGTHRNTRTVLKRGEHADPEWVAEWEKQRSPERMMTKRGDVVLRDTRMWHCGMPNYTDTPRPMIAMIHKVPWWGRGGVEFEKGTEDFLTHPVLKTNAVFVDPPIDYLMQGHSRPLHRGK